MWHLRWVEDDKHWRLVTPLMILFAVIYDREQAEKALAEARNL